LKEGDELENSIEGLKSPFTKAAYSYALQKYMRVAGNKRSEFINNG
jgi:hypothetical protein